MVRYDIFQHHQEEFNKCEISDITNEKNIVTAPSKNLRIKRRHAIVVTVSGLRGV